MAWEPVLELFQQIVVAQTGFLHVTWGNVFMWGLGLLFLYMATRGIEPLLLVPIGFGVFIVNFPLTPLMGYSEAGHPHLIQAFFHYGLEWEILPPVIFLGLGTLTDFGPLIANPRVLIIGAGAQLGVFVTFLGVLFFGFTLEEAASVGIIAGADGPTTVYLTAALAPHLLGANAVAAYSYMALVPIIQPPIMRLLIRKEDRKIRMDHLRQVSSLEKLLFPLIGTAVIALLVPSVMPLMAMFMFGNFMRECGVVKRLVDTSGGALMNIVTVFLGLSVGATMEASAFLGPEPLIVMGFGMVGFILSTAGGIWTVQLLNRFSKNKMNPLIGSAGVSAVPMAARVSQTVGLQESGGTNYLLMHAMGPNLAGVMGTATAAGMYIAMFK